MPACDTFSGRMVSWLVDCACVRVCVCSMLVNVFSCNKTKKGSDIYSYKV